MQDDMDVADMDGSCAVCAAYDEQNDVMVPSCSAHSVAIWNNTNMHAMHILFKWM